MFHIRSSSFYAIGGDFGSDTFLDVLLRQTFFFCWDCPHFFSHFCMTPCRYPTLWSIQTTRNRQRPSVLTPSGPVVLHWLSYSATSPQTRLHRCYRTSPPSHPPSPSLRLFGHVPTSLPTTCGTRGPPWGGMSHLWSWMRLLPFLFNDLRDI